MAGWNASAKKGATGESYEIRTVADFLKVPESRRRICLREFNAWLTMAESIPELYRITAESMGVPDPALVPRMDAFVWHDDGKATVSAVIREHAPTSDGSHEARGEARGTRPDARQESLNQALPACRYCHDTGCEGCQGADQALADAGELPAIYLAGAAETAACPSISPVGDHRCTKPRDHELHLAHTPTGGEITWPPARTSRLDV